MPGPFGLHAGMKTTTPFTKRGEEVKRVSKKMFNLFAGSERVVQPELLAGLYDLATGPAPMRDAVTSRRTTSARSWVSRRILYWRDDAVVPSAMF